MENIYMNFNSRIDRAKCLKAGIDQKTIEKLYLIDNEIIVTNVPLLQENPVLQFLLGSLLYEQAKFSNIPSGNKV